MWGSMTVDRAKPVVLFVDDEQPNLRTFARQFRTDFVVRTATSAVAALELLGGEHVDVLITDYSMPGGDGLFLLRQVQQRWPAIARVVLSGYTDLADLKAAEQEGLVGALMSKPWDADQVRALVARLHARNSRVDGSE